MAQRIEVLKSHVARGLEVEFVYDISSFNAYRAHKRVDLVFGDLPSVPLRYRPILLGGLFRALVPDVNYASKLPDGTPFVQYGPVPWDASMPKARDTKVETFASMLPGITLKAREGCHEVTRSLRAGAPVMHAMRLCASAGAGQGRAVCEEFMALYHVRNLAMLPGDTAAAAAKFGLADGKKALLASTQAAISADDVAGVPTFIIRHPDRAPVSFFGVDRMPLMHQYFSDMFKLNLSTDDIARIHKLRVTGDGSLLSRADTPMLPGAALVVYHHIASPWSFFAVEQAEALRRAFPALRVDYRAADLAAVQREAGVNPSVLQAKFPNKKRMLAAEVQRWARWHGLPALHENATGRTMGLDEYVDPQQGAAHMRLAAACPERTGEVYRSYWIDGSVEAALAPAAGGGGAADVLRRNTEEALRLGASRLPLIDVPSTECALSADFQNPLAFYMAVDYLCGWRPSVVE